MCREGNCMIFNKGKYRKFLLLFVGWLNAPLAFSNPNFLSNLPSSLKHGHAIIQLGGYWSIQGQAQHINLQDLVGDEFTITNHKGSNGLVGWGYFVDGQEKERFNMVYGINAFYLAKTAVTGNVIQENLFTNLSYQYNVTHYPVYAVAKAIIKAKSAKHALTLDVGIGPNFMRTSGFNESPLDGITIPDNIFSSRTTTTFTATIGAGFRFNQVFGELPLECGYRLFYLGQGHFNKQTSQVVNTLNTGPNYANAVMCSITI